MKAFVKRAIKEETGAALALALVLLVVGGLILTPLLGLMSAGLIAGQVYERKTDELYAADAGVEEALWRIQVGNVTPPSGCNPTNYWVYNISSVNGKRVVYNMTWRGLNNRTCVVVSTATGNGSSTRVEAYLGVTLTSFLDNAITADGDVRISSGVTVNGTVQHGGQLKNLGTINGQNISTKYPKWPTAADLRTYYNVDSLPILAVDNPQKELIDIKNHATIKGRRNGNLKIDNTGANRTLELDGTLYVTGDLTFEQPGANNPYTIDLNGKTIFVEGTIYFPSQRVTVEGSGCIIARGEITFQPGIASSPSDFVLVMSLSDDVTFQPSGGTFYGSIAGASVQSDIDLKANIVWQPLAEGGIDFPIEGYGVVKKATISTYEVSGR